MQTPNIQSRSIGSGHPIVLLHAFPLSHLIWSEIQPPQGFRFVLPDFPGFGSAPLAPKGLSLKDAALGLRKHLEESGVEWPIRLGGISMGGYWAMEFVRQFPEIVQDLILISTRPGVDKPENRQKNPARAVLRRQRQYPGCQREIEDCVDEHLAAADAIGHPAPEHRSRNGADSRR